MTSDRTPRRSAGRSGAGDGSLERWSRQYWIKIGIETGTPVAAVAAWGFYTTTAENFFFPTLGKIADAFAQTWLGPGLLDDAAPSLVRMLSGYVLASVLGLAGGFCLGLLPRVRSFVSPVLHFSRTLPAPALLPFAMLAFGIGNTTKIALIAFGCLFPILLSTMDGVRAVDDTYVQVGRSYGISRRRQLTQIILPAALPNILAGMRTSLALALILIVVSEMVASTSGIGYFVLEAQRNFRLPEMWAGMVLLGLIGVVFNAAFVAAEKRALRWYYASRAAAL